MRKGQSKGQLLEPIVVWDADAAGDERLLMDARALMIHLGISDRTVRRYRTFEVKRDKTTGTPLYDAVAIGVERERVRSRLVRQEHGAAPTATRSGSTCPI